MPYPTNPNPNPPTNPNPVYNPWANLPPPVDPNAYSRITPIGTGSGNNSQGVPHYGGSRKSKKSNKKSNKKSTNKSRRYREK